MYIGVVHHLGWITTMKASVNSLLAFVLGLAIGCTFSLTIALNWCQTCASCSQTELIVDKQLFSLFSNISNRPQSAGIKEPGKPLTIISDENNRSGNTTRNIGNILSAVFAGRELGNPLLAAACDTWGLTASKFLTFVELQSPASTNISIEEPSIVELNTTDDTYLSAILKYVHKYHYYYNWYVIATTNTYIQMDRLKEELNKMNPDSVIYIAGKALDLNYCSVEPGVVLSRAAMQRVMLKCDLKGDENVKLQTCISKVLGFQCSNGDQTGELVLKLSEGISLDVKTFWNIIQLEKALLIYPMRYPKDIYTLHTYLEFLKYREKTNSTTNQLIGSNSDSKNEKCLQEGFGKLISSKLFHPKTRYHAVSWSYFDSHTVYVDKHIYPKLKLGMYNSWNHEIKAVMKEVNKVGTRKKSTSLSFQKVVNGYMKHDPLFGNEYTVDAEFLNINTGKPVFKQIHLTQPLSNMYISEVKTLNKQDVIHFVVPISYVGKRLEDFMAIYESICLKIDENCHLILSVISNEIHSIDNELKIYQDRYPNALFTILKSNGTFSRGTALDLGISSLKENDLMFLCDVDMLISKEFLARCRTNTIQNKQIYYPECFKLYNMKYVYPNQEPLDIDIQRKHGHWADYAFGMACMYKSDYDSVGGFNKEITGWGGEDVELYERILKANIEVFRAPDIGLIHRWHEKTCSKTETTKKQYKHCLSSKTESLADRQQLAEYVLHMED